MSRMYSFRSLVAMVLSVMMICIAPLTLTGAVEPDDQNGNKKAVILQEELKKQPKAPNPADDKQSKQNQHNDNDDKNNQNKEEKATPPGQGKNDPQKQMPVIEAAPLLAPLAPVLPSEDFLVLFKPGTPSATKRSINADNNVLEKDIIPGINVHVLSTPAGKTAAEMIARYKNNPNVVFAEPDYTATAQLAPNDYYYTPYQIGLQNTSPQAAWDVTIGSNSVPIAVLDTGIYYKHVDLTAKVMAGYDFIYNDSDAIDDAGHGTHCAGIIGAATNNGQGVAGVAWSNPLMPVKVLNSSGSGAYSTVAQGIIYAADNGAKVINMSLGGPDPSAALESAIQYALNKGVVVVAAAGNSGAAVLYPAAYPGVIAVGAVDNNDVRAGFSCYGPEVAVSAPGVQVWSTMMFEGQSPYTNGSGTSFAAPFVAGLAGLVLSANPNLTPAQVKDIIQRGADDLGTAGYDNYYGHGRINMAKTIALAQDPNQTPVNPPTDPVPIPQPEPTPLPEPEPAPVPQDPTPPPPPEPSIDTYVFTGNLSVSRQALANNHTFLVKGSGTLDAKLVWGQKKADLNLYLYDSTGRLLASSKSSSSASLKEIISFAISPGTYVLKVEAVKDKASYTLTVVSPR